MHRLWKPIVEPLLAAAAPRVILEIGAAEGLNTANLIEFARRTDAAIHIVDPKPTDALMEMVERSPDLATLHRAPSLAVVGDLEPPDAVLIDGDHNWYTVLEELRLLERHCEQHGFPLTLLHDVGWPYGRRDMYYEPDRVPARFRHEYARQGMRPDSDDLDPEGGLNPTLNNAVVSGGDANGVLTAVEDFLSESKIDAGLLRISGFHGIAVLYPQDLMQRNPAAAELLGSTQASTPLLGLLDAVERDRVATSVRARDLQIRVHELSAEARDAERLATETTAALQVSQASLEATRSAHARLTRRRSVRFALRVAALFAPVFRIWRRIRVGARRG